MASAMTASEMRDVRSLAQKLYGQCRDSPSIYKSVAPNVRKLRNILEEVEEVVSEGRNNSAIELQVTERVTHCKSILQELDLTLQAYRCSTHKWQEVKPTVISDLKSDFEHATDSLSAAFDALTNTAEIELRFDTTAIAVAENLRLNSVSTPSTGSRHERRSSQTSFSAPQSQSSVADGASSQSGHEDGKSASEEKEVYDMGRAYLLSPSQTSYHTASTDHLEMLDWRTPFASPDPLSIDIDRASSLLLRTPETVKSAQRDRFSVSSTSSTPFVDARLTQSPPPPGLKRESLDTSTSPVAETKPHKRFEPAPGLGILIPHDAAGARLSSNRNSNPSSSVDDQQAGPGAEDQRTETAEADAASAPTSPKEDVRNTDTEDERIALQNVTPSEKPDTVVVQQAPQPPPTLLPPKSRFSVPAESIPRSDGVDSPIAAPSRIDSKLGVSEEPGSMFETTPEEAEPESPLTTTHAPAGNSPALMIEPKSKNESPATKTPPLGPALLDKELPSPPVPSRRPPPPPPPRTNSKAEGTTPLSSPRTPRVPKGRYRVVNPSPPSQRSSNATDDLYSSSRPSSPTLATPTTSHVRAQSHDIPRIQIHPDESQAAVSERHIESPVTIKKDPPVVPPRPSRYKSRSMSEMRNPMVDMPGNNEAKTQEGAGLEVDDRLHARRSDLALRPRQSVDDAMEQPSPLLRPIEMSPSGVQRSRSISAPIIEVPQPRQVPQDRPQAPTHEFYAGRVGPVAAANIQNDSVNIDAERIERICKCWNSQLWESADAYLIGHLESLVENDDLQGARRVRHLLGVSASFKGHWQRALEYFLSVLNTPVNGIEILDQGDFAAAYWLGDTYAILNRRTEALISYSLAEHIHASQSNPHVGVQNVLCADQEAVQLGASRGDLVAALIRDLERGDSGLEGSILASKIMPREVARYCLETRPRSSMPMKIALKPESSRASTLFHFDRSYSNIAQYLGVKIVPDSFENHHPWPVPYDPYFVMANVVNGRLIQTESNLLELLSNSMIKVPRTGPLGPSRLDCFTCSQLDWLIINMRECLSTLQMEWSECANKDGVFFRARFKTMRDKIMTYTYFAISLFKQGMRTSYGVQVCSDSICSTRIVNGSLSDENGVSTGVEKRIKKLIKEHLTQAYKDRAKTGKQTSGSDSPVPTKLSPSKSTAGRLSMSYEGAPLLPARMSVSGL